MDAKQKRLLREHKERRETKQQDVPSEQKSTYNKNSFIQRTYHDHYKVLLLFTVGITFISLLIIANTYYTTGDIFYKGVSLSGGITLTVSTQGHPVDIKQLETELRTTYPKNDLSIREISDFGTQQGFTIEASTATGERQSLSDLSKSMVATLGKEIPDINDRISIEETGSALGASFFEQTLKAILIAFVSMGLVVFLYFGETLGQKIMVSILSLIEAAIIWYAAGWLMAIVAIVIGVILFMIYIRYSIPSTAVIIAAACTIIFTIAVVDAIGMRISTAGIAAFLMLLGYSVDTDILLSTRVLKSNVGTAYDRTVSTFKTGVTMTGTTFAAALVSYLFTQSDVIKEIMLIICIGIVADIFNTWIQNAGILRWHLEKKQKESNKQSNK